MTLALLYLLATIDGALCGIRVAGGRSPLIHKRMFYARWLLRGVLAAQAASFVALVALVAAIGLSAHRLELRADLESAAARMVWVFVPYAIIVLANLALRLVPSTDIRSATSVMVLGPLTGARPFVMIAGVLYGIWASWLLETRLLGLLVLTLMLSLERLLDGAAGKEQAREVAGFV
jgi:hypothetical protein